jgi:hypothetical protein
MAIAEPADAGAYLAAIRTVPAFAALGLDDEREVAGGLRRCGYALQVADASGSAPLEQVLAGFAVAEPGFTAADMEAALAAAIAHLCPQLRTEPMPRGGGS